MGGETQRNLPTTAAILAKRVQNRKLLASRRFPRQWPLLRLKLQVLSKLLAASQPALPPWKQVQPLLQAFPAQQDLGPYQDRLTAPQPQGPMTQGLLKKGTQDADSILSQIQMMKMLELPFFSGFLVNNMPCWRVCLAKKSRLQQPTCPSGFLAKQVLHLLDLYVAREPKANN